jgi:hypothetical protein
VVVGQHNETKDNMAFSVGVGSSNAARKNALEVYNDGKMVVNNIETSEIITDKLVSNEITTKNLTSNQLNGLIDP